MSGLGKEVKKSHSAWTKIWQVFGILVIIGIFIGSIFFYFGVAQPSIVDTLSENTSKQLNKRLLDYQNATKTANDVVLKWSEFVREYGSEACSIEVRYESTKAKRDINSTKQLLEYGSDEQVVQKYGVWYSQELVDIVNATNIRLLKINSALLSRLSEYNEVDTFVDYLETLRNVCKKTAELENTGAAPSQVALCSELKTAYGLWVEPQSEWQQKARELTKTYLDECSKKKTSNEVFTDFFSYFTAVVDTGPDTAALQEEMEKYLNEATKEINTGKRDIQTAQARKHLFENWWYLLSI